MSRDVKLLILDMIEACEHIARFVAGSERADFETWSLQRAAVERMLLVLGEAGKCVPPEIRLRASDVPWRDVAGLRDRLAHAYADIDPDILWRTATIDAPRIEPALRRLLADLDADGQ